MGRHNSEVMGLGFGQGVLEVIPLVYQHRAKVLRWSLAIILSLGTFAAIGPSSALARNHCKDRCNDRYNLRKDECKSIPYSRERHRCENAAKHAKDQCRHDCH